MNERYRHEEAPSDYLHDRHAGNIGDVWKHVAILPILSAVQRSAESVTVVETHSGAGAYRLGSTGEWEEGIGTLLKDRELTGLLAEFLDGQPVCSGTPEYRGSPAIIEERLRPGDLGVFYERNPEVAARLERLLEGSAARAVVGDGRAFLRGEYADAREAHLVIIDPPWSAKADWREIPEEVIGFHARFPDVVIVLWYPIKSYTRINAMLARFREAGTGFSLFELLTSPLGDRRNRLNGSGLLVVNCPSGVAEELAPAGATIGSRCGLNGWWRYVAEHDEGR